MKNQQAKELKYGSFSKTITYEDPKIRKLIDVPPYPSIRYTSRGFEAFREREEEKSGWDYSINEDKAEDINAEAEAFIKSMHRKFEVSKLMSSKSFY
ncbi:hypothetical protein H5410_021820 [Solanum commersonii]|uniref:Uncharacterized protein n=1 Tax=Solanum commersonii TaxID=4109 RepID=A0A9J5ZC49_SOLCO|nr:hypothetical protein H5410_021820 [Solanum commersonii]